MERKVSNRSTGRDPTVREVRDRRVRLEEKTREYSEK
jgi:hypothetical protein